MKMQKLIDKFNEPDVHLVISEWPSRDSRIPHHGVAAFTKETLVTLARDRNMRFVVLSETNIDNTPQLICNGKILILRVFDHRRHTLYPIILQWLTKFFAIRRVTVHSEFNAYTGLGKFLLLIPFLALIKLAGRSVTYVAHNVADNLESFAPYLNITNDKYIHNLLSRCISVYYSLLGRMTDQIITLDFQAYKTLGQYVTEKKLFYIPHWVKPRRIHTSRAKARAILGIPPHKGVIVSFGFISWYKGSDILAKLFAKRNPKDAHLIFAGGKHVVRQNQETYRLFHDQFESIVTDAPSITYTGFIPEEKIELYYAAADLVVLPYRELIGGSGALSWAIGYGKPFLVSDQMKAILTNPDIKDLMKTSKTTAQNITFTLDDAGVRKVLSTAASGNKLRRLAMFSRSLRTKRDIHRVGKTFYNEVYVPTPSLRAALAGY